MSRNDVIIGVAALVLVVFSLVVSIVVPRRDPGFPGRRIGVFTAVAVTLVVIMLATVEVVGEAHEAEGAEEGGESVPAETDGGGGGDAAAGEAIFVENCGSCHTLEEAGTSGTVGPNLDDSTLDLQAVVEQVTNGGGAMPPFGGQLSEAEIQNVAAFVVASQG
ncbi:MAG TPA: cytochrome c [Gaiellaceae bacterium]|nr:cytochrome c [Gaiellaceae bacterium]